MMYPQSNAARMILDLGGVWDFRFRGDQEWQTVSVPASYNDQNPDPRYRNFAGVTEYRRTVTVPAAWKGMRVCLRFDGAAHSARVLLDGKEIGHHRGGFLPFEIELDGILAAGEHAVLTVETDNRISHDTLPIGTEGGTAFFGSDNPGIAAVEAGKRFQQEHGINRPAFDFFNYTGIQRPVRLVATPRQYIRDLTLITFQDGRVCWHVETEGTGEDVKLEILDAEGQTVSMGEGREGMLRVPRPRLWEPRPGTPYLYTARVTYGEDIYEQPFGIREVKVEGTRFLINGKPFYFHGPCKHEDSAFHGRGMDQVVNVTDSPVPLAACQLLPHQPLSLCGGNVSAVRPGRHCDCG